MPLRRVKLTADAREKALELGIPVGFIQDPNQDVRPEGDEIEVRNRDYHLLRAHGLVEDAELVAPAADQPEAEAMRDLAQRDNMMDDTDADTSGRTHTSSRGPSGTSRGVHPGGVGHQPDDAYTNAGRVQSEIMQDQSRGAVARAEQGLGSVTDDELDENLRRDGRLSKEREKEARDAKGIEKSQRQAERDTEKAQEKEAKHDAEVAKVSEKDKQRSIADAEQASGVKAEDQGRDDAERPKSGDKLDQRTAGRASRNEGPDAKAAPEDKDHNKGPAGTPSKDKK